MRRVLGRMSWLFKPWDPAVVRSLLVLSFVLVFGTAGYTWIEGWSPWNSLFFTLVTITTVGYGDYGLSEAGERFTAVVMIGGIGTASFALSQILTSTVASTMKPEKRMLSRAKQLSDHHIICGCGRMGRRVARRFEEAGVPFVIIDMDAACIDQAIDDGFIALRGDCSEDDVLHDAGIERASALAALTSSDAINALICLTAHAIAPDLAIIARADEEASICKLKRAGAARVLSPCLHGADGVAENMLRPEVARVLYGDEASLSTEGHHEALRFAQIVVEAGSPLVGREVRAVGHDHPRVVFVAAAADGGELSLRPSPDHVFNAGDVLVIAGDSEEIASLGMGKRAA